jgi:transposase
VLQGRSQGEVSRDLGVSAWSLGEWVKKAKAGKVLSHPKTLDTESDQECELRRLRAENDYLRQQREILKKALGILSAEVPAHVSR